MIKERYMSSGRYFIICGSKQDATNQKEIALAATNTFHFNGNRKAIPLPLWWAYDH